MEPKKIKLIAIIVAVLAVIGVGVASAFGFGDDSDSTGNAAPTSDPSPTISSTPFAQETLEATTPAETPAPVETTEAPEPEPSDTPDESEGAPAISPDLEIIEIDGFGAYEAMEANLTEEEIQARQTIYDVIPVVANKASSRYENGYGARDELRDKGLISDRMAEEYFLPEFTPFEQTLNETGFTVQTSGIRCYMRGQTPVTAIELGQVTCYYTRGYVDEDGRTISNYQYVEATGGAGSIDPTQIARVLVNVVKEDGVWKVDDVNFNAR